MPTLSKLSVDAATLHALLQEIGGQVCIRELDYHWSGDRESLREALRELQAADLVKPTYWMAVT